MAAFEDHPHFKMWERAEAAANQEKDWMHQRLSWLFTTQGILFVAFAAALRFSNIDVFDPATPGLDLPAVSGVSGATSFGFESLVALIPYFGVASAIPGVLGTFAAACMHWQWTTNLNLIAKHVATPGVLTFGSWPHWPARSSSILPVVQSYLFVWIWISIILSANGMIWDLAAMSAVAPGLTFYTIFLIQRRIRKTDAKMHWTPNAQAVWPPAATDEQAHIEAFDPETFPINRESLYVFDFDGVLCSASDEDVYQLDEVAAEEELLQRMSNHFGIPCDHMAQKYRRHLLYQAAADRTGEEMREGPCIEVYDKALAIAPGFVLSARSGWYAIERARAFLAKRNHLPIETFHVGRVAKDRQISILLKEFDGKSLIYVEDNRRHLEAVWENLSIEERVKVRLFHVKHAHESKPTQQETRQHFEQLSQIALGEHPETRND